MSHCCLHRGEGDERTKTSVAHTVHVSHVVTRTLMLWWTGPLAVCTVVRSPAAVFREQRPSLCWEQGQPNFDGRLVIRCRVMDLFVPLRAERPPDRGLVEQGGLQSLGLDLQSQSVSLWSPRAVWSLVVCPLGPLWGAVLPMLGMKLLSLEPSWWSGVPGSNRAKSESMQRSLLRVKMLWGRSSKEASESLRRQLYLVRRSMPAESKKVLPSRTSKSFAISRIMPVMTEVQRYLRNLKSFPWLKSGQVCSLVIRELQNQIES